MDSGGALPAFVAMAVVLFPAIALSGDLDRAPLACGRESQPGGPQGARSGARAGPARSAGPAAAWSSARPRGAEWTEAIDVFEALRLEHPAMPEPYNNLAVLHATQGQLEHARAALLAAIERQPDFAAAYANLSGVYARLADRALRRAAELRRRRPGARRGRARRAHEARRRGDEPGPLPSASTRRPPCPPAPRP